MLIVVIIIIVTVPVIVTITILLGSEGASGAYAAQMHILLSTS